MLLKQLDELFHRLRVQIQLRRIRSHRCKPLRRARVFNLRRQKIQKDEIDVLEFVSARFHKLSGDHPIRHMPAQPHSAFMSRFRNPGNELRLQRAIKFDLNVPKVRVAIDRRLRLFSGVGIQPGRRLKRSVSIDEPAFPHTRPDCGAALPLLFQSLQLFDAISHVAHTGHAARDVQQAIQRLRVRVHVE